MLGVSLIQSTSLEPTLIYDKSNISLPYYKYSKGLLYAIRDIEQDNGLSGLERFNAKILYMLLSVNVCLSVNVIRK